MLYHKKYDIDPSFVSGETINWVNTGNGVFAIGTAGGQRYFIKRYTMGPRIPAKTIPDPTYSELLAVAKGLENKQAEMRKLMSGLNVDVDHVVVEEDNFWDEDGLFTTVTRCIPDEDKDFDFTKVGLPEFLSLCAAMAETIKKIHAAGVTHGDLKPKNIIMQKSGAGHVPYLIDFDSSYPSDYGTRKDKSGKPLLSYPVVFSPGYQSPEIAIYNFEDEGVIDPATITDKTDIFTLGLIFHELWTGGLPLVIGDDCPVGEAVYLDTEIKLDSKFNVEIGPNNKNKFADLIKWMLVKDIDKRPTADQVVEALCDRLDIGEFFEGAETAARFDSVPHAVHKDAVEILDKDALKGLGLKALQKVTKGGMYGYYVKYADGTEKTLTVQEIIAAGFAKAKSTAVGALWPDDAAKIEIVSADELAAQGVVSIEPREAGVKKFYYIRLLSGLGFTTSGAGLVDRGLAVRKPEATATATVSEDGTPWPEHGSAYNTVEMAKKNVVSVKKTEVDGDHRYTISIGSGTDVKEIVVKIGYMKMMGFIV